MSDAQPISYAIAGGYPHPLGAVPDLEGVNFSIFSQHATAVELLLFDQHNSCQPQQVINLDPDIHRTFHFWHVYVKGLQPGAHYAYRMNGPQDLHQQGHRFDPNKVLLDPYAKAYTNTLWDRDIACNPGDNLDYSMRSVVIDPADYDWEGDRPLHRPMNETIIYELHVRGFTQSASSGCKHPGTFLGLIEKIPYLQNLGITAVELLPVFDFDETEILRTHPQDNTPLRNYWGYSPISFFAPQSWYCTKPEVGSHSREFRDMVKAFHRAGIEVILDVVFNHTGEGNHLGPTINLKGIDNSIYYYLDPVDRQYYRDYSGCGNTLDCNHPVVTKLIVESLEFWVQEMHVDGFRFDEGSILSRGEDGTPMVYPPVLWYIELSEKLANTKIIAEAWDAAGLYQVGYFPGFRWAEWNGRYRDDVRRFVRGDPGMVGAIASRIAGSSDIYQATGRLPINSINFITCHDGFTLNDLVSYNQKHNDANGEENRDGLNENLSWNCGVEGETDDPEIEALRQRQIKNFIVLLLLSRGVPMILAGDEVRRSQRGNNNAYCQDNEIGWFNWQLVEQQWGLLRFVRQMIALRQRHDILHSGRFFSGQPNLRGVADITWYTQQLGSPNWSDSSSHILAFTFGGSATEPDIHVMLNMESRDYDFEIPDLGVDLSGRSTYRHWCTVVNTALASPDDIAEPGQEKLVTNLIYGVKSHSVVVLISNS